MGCGKIFLSILVIGMLAQAGAQAGVVAGKAQARGEGSEPRTPEGWPIPKPTDPNANEVANAEAKKQVPPDPNTGMLRPEEGATPGKNSAPTGQSAGHPVAVRARMVLQGFRGERINAIKKLITPMIVKKIQADMKAGASDQKTAAAAAAAGAAMAIADQHQAQEEIKSLQEQQEKIDRALTEEQAKPGSPYVKELRQEQQNLAEAIEEKQKESEMSGQQQVAMEETAAQSAAQDDALASATVELSKNAGDALPNADAQLTAAATNGSTTGVGEMATTDAAELGVGFGSTHKSLQARLAERQAAKLAAAAASEKDANGGQSATGASKAMDKPLGGKGSDVNSKLASLTSIGKIGEGGRRLVNLSGIDSRREISSIMNNLMGESRGLASSSSDAEFAALEAGVVLAATSKSLFARVTDAIDKIAPTRGLLR
jgi:hypothetical protein